VIFKQQQLRDSGPAVFLEGNGVVVKFVVVDDDDDDDDDDVDELNSSVRV